MFYFLSQETASSGFFFRECLYLSTYAFTRFATFAELTSPLLLWQTYNSFKERKKKKKVWNISVVLPLFHIIYLPNTPHSSISGSTPRKTPSTSPTAPQVFLSFPSSHPPLSNKKPVMSWGAEKTLVDGERPRYFCFSCSPSQQLPVVPTRLRKPPSIEMYAFQMNRSTYFIHSFPHNFFIFFLSDVFILVERLNS